MILQTAFFRFRLVLACGLWVVGSRLLVVKYNLTDNLQPITYNRQPPKMLSNEVAALFCIVF